MTSSVYERIRAAIVSGEIPSKQRLAEVALAEQFGTSRTPVREALQRLESERLIERTHRGTFVRQIQPEEVFDIYDVLSVLEGFAARTATERATPWNLLQLRTAHQAMVDFTEPDPPRRAELNREFHEVLAAAAQSQTTARVLQQLNSNLIVTARTTLAVEERWEATLTEHAQILEAIEARDGDTAARIAEEHMIAARDVRVQFYRDASVTTTSS